MVMTILRSASLLYGGVQELSKPKSTDTSADNPTYALPRVYAMRCALLLITTVVGRTATPTSTISGHSRAANTNRSDAVANLFEWFGSVGGQNRAGLEFHEIDGSGGGLFASESIKAGTRLLDAPFRIIFSAGDAKLANESNLVLAESVLTNREPRWLAYLASLPRDCQAPVCGLPFPPGTAATRAFDQLLAVERARVPPRLLVAYSLVVSRQFPLGLIPVFDLVNHADLGYHNARVAWDRRIGRLFLDAVSDIPRGGEITFDYLAG